MKIIILFSIMLLLGLCPGLKAQRDTDSQAMERAEREYNTLSNRGWEAYHGDLRQMLEYGWKLHFELDEKGEHVYVRTYGGGRNQDKEAAISEAIEKAREFVSNPMVLYFQTWNANKRMKGDISTEDSHLIRDVISDIHDKIYENVSALEVEPQVVITRPGRRNTHEATVRIYYNQLELREFVRNLIVDELLTKTSWSREEAIARLTYDH